MASVYGLGGGTASGDGRVAWSSSCSRNAHTQKVLVRWPQSETPHALARIGVEMEKSVRTVVYRKGHEVEPEDIPLDLVQVIVPTYLAATISRSSTSNTIVAPGLI
jgi:hypothetical protein